ncbi:MAG TPA: S1 RNA-binding domain-containing protein [Candidatus Hydrogenedentes bacterium]|nr:S1 RNA-binding domain-containing protein [Candidatus Hydrogenedentota bacterium]
MVKYVVNQKVDVTVERVLPFGVFVRLPNGASGYIRRRELDLDADVTPSEIVQDGQKIQAVVIKVEEADTKIELSRRATLKDPWPEFAQHNHEGDVVRGTVRALHPNGAFVRVQAGVNGFVPLAEIASWQVDKPENVLWVGDTVETIITNLNTNNQRLTLSIKALMLQRDVIKSPSRTVHQPAVKLPMSAQAIPVSLISPEMRDQLGTILVVDDDDEVRSSLTLLLNQRGFVALEAESLENAVNQIEKHNCQLLLADLNLVEKDGLDLVRLLRKNGNRAHICIMSSLVSLTERAEEIEIAQVAQVFPKPLDIEEIEAFLLRLARGEPIQAWRAAPSPSPMSREVELTQRDHIPIQQGIQTTLEQVTQLLRAEIGLIFRLDSVSRTISILAQAGDAPMRMNAIYGLSASPVEDVIREGEPIYEAHSSEHAKTKFAKLLELLPFESCIGVPIQVDDEIQHAVFFFHQKPDAFSQYRLRDAQAGSLLLAALLSREVLGKRLQSLNPMLLSGELARGFGHDVFNKITALDLETRLLIGEKTLDEVQTSAQHLLDLIVDLKATVQAFQQLLQTKETQESFDVNQVVSNAVSLLRPIAHKDHTRIEVNLAANLPPVSGNNIILQQVFLNLMLNAVQQMSLKADNFQWSGQRLLRVTVSLNKKLQRIRIRFVDNGPGIHQTYLKKIFSLGFSTRGGSGLGLYIARGFIQSLRGTLRVQETLVPLGTIFVVEVPYLPEEAIQ